MKQIVTAAGVVNASIIKDFLVTNAIHATYAPSQGSAFLKFAASTPTTAQWVYVSEEMAEEALKLLKEEGLIQV